MWGSRGFINSKYTFFQRFFKFQGGRDPSQPNEQPSEPDRLGGGRGRVNPPPRRLVWRFSEVWRVCCLGQGIYTPGGQRPRRMNIYIYICFVVCTRAFIDITNTICAEALCFVLCRILWRKGWTWESPVSHVNAFTAYATTIVSGVKCNTGFRRQT